ncbi:MAG: enoyl-CoA hydratase/isomerase family protein [Deltaproteobacteria bacterium]
MNEYIKNEIRDHYAKIEFFHPSHNSMSMALLAALSELFVELNNVDDIKCIILTSAGQGSFCAGANFEELKNIRDEKEGLEFFSGFGNVINSMRQCSKLVIGRIHGKSVGGGVGLISACDIAFGTIRSSIRLSELAIGIGPFVIAPAVIRKTGIAAFSDLSLNPAEWKGPEWAQAHGLFSKVFNDTVEMDDFIINYIESLSSFSTEAIAENKRLLWSGTDDWAEVMKSRAAISGKLILNSKF